MTFRSGRAAMLGVMIAAVCGGPWGCALKAHRTAQPPSDEVRAQLNTVGVPVARLTPGIDLHAPTRGKGWGAAKGAGYGLAAGAMPGLHIAGSVRGCGGGGGLGGVVCGAVALLGLGVAAAGGAGAAGGGAVYGAVKADSASSVEAAESELTRVLAEVNVQTALRDHVLRAARDRGSFKFVAVGDAEPTAVGEPIDHRALTNEG